MKISLKKKKRIHCEKYLSIRVTNTLSAVAIKNQFKKVTKVYSSKKLKLNVSCDIFNSAHYLEVCITVL